MKDKIIGESIEIITGMKVMTEAGTDLEKGHFPEAIVATVGLDQDQGLVQIETE